MTNEEWKKQKEHRPGPLILIGLLLIAMGISGYLALKNRMLYKAGSDVYQKVSDGAVKVEESSAPPAETSKEPAKAEESKEQEKEKEKPPITVDFEKLRSENPEIVAWIYIPDTNINYPVVQGSDNSYYLSHLVDGTENVDGTIFADCRAEPFALQNTVLYGHHMRDGSMFQNLVEYKQQSFYDEHPILYVLTPDGNYKVNLLWGAVIASDDLLYYNSVTKGSELYNDLERVAEKTTFRSTAEYHEDDKLITLSTCSYEYDGARFVVIGQMEEMG